MAANSSPGHPTESHETVLINLVSEALVRIEGGATVVPAELCRDRPELEPALVEALGMRGRLPGLQTAAAVASVNDTALLASRYKLAGPLGRGAMGVVFAAHDLELDREVAIKRYELDSDDAKSKERFKREAESLAGLRSPQPRRRLRPRRGRPRPSFRRHGARSRGFPRYGPQ